jgi:hypothetical protein
MKKNYQTNTLRMIWEMFYEEKMKEYFIPAPIQTSNSVKGKKAFNETINFFNNITSGNGANLLPVISK